MSAQDALLEQLWFHFESHGPSAELSQAQCEQLLGSYSPQDVSDAAEILSQAGLVALDQKMNRYAVSLNERGWARWARQAGIPVDDIEAQILKTAAKGTCSGDHLVNSIAVDRRHLIMALRRLES